MTLIAKNYIRIFAGLLFGFVIFYGPYIAINPIATPDDLKIFVTGLTRQCCQSAFDTLNWQAIGRGIGGFVANLQLQFISEPGDLIYARIFDAVFQSIICFAFFVYFKKFIRPIYALALSVGVNLLPAFILGVIWVHAFAFLLVAPLLAFVAGILAILDGSRYLVWSGRIAAAALLLICLYMYQSSAMFFFVPIGFRILFDINLQSIQAKNKVIVVIGTFLIVAPIYFLIQKYIFLPELFARYPQFNDQESPARWRIAGTESKFALQDVVLEKFYLLKAVATKVLQLWYPFDPIGLHWVFASILAGGLIIGRSTCDTLGDRVLRKLAPIDVTCFILLVMFSVVPNFVSAGGTESLRTLGACSSLVLFSLYWSIARLHNRWPKITLSRPILLAIGAVVILGLMTVIIIGGVMAKARYYAVQAEIVSTPFPIATVKNVAPYIGGVSEFGIPYGHELTATTVNKEMVNLALSSLGHSRIFKYLETSGADPEIGVAPGDVLIDHRYQTPTPAFTFSAFDRLYRPVTVARRGICDGSLTGASVQMPPLSEWEPLSLRVEKADPHRTNLIVTSLGEARYQRLSRRISINAQKGNMIRAQFAVKASAGVNTVGFRMTALPDLSESFYVSTPVAPGEWTCVTIERQISLDVQTADVFVYPTTSAEDNDSRPHLGAEVAGLSISVEKPTIASSRPLRKLWRISSNYDSYEITSRLANAVDGTPDTLWIVNSSEPIDLIVDLPERKGVLTGLRLKGDTATNTNTFFPLPSSVKVYGLTEGGQWDALSDQMEIQPDKSEKLVALLIPNTKFYKKLKLTFTPPVSLPWAIDEVQPKWDWALKSTSINCPIKFPESVCLRAS